MSIRTREPSVPTAPEDYTPLVGEEAPYRVLPHAGATAPVDGLLAHVYEDGSVLLVFDRRAAATFQDVKTAGAVAFLIETALRAQRQAMAH